ncbi:MAG: hypothetical protein IJO20_03330 [Ruminococcus sp.]|nr:hypothetical protein [Ruminococcus sp.]
MLTSLYIETPQYNSKLGRMLGRLMFDTMRVEIRSAEDINVKCIEYINRSGKVNFSKIDKEVGAQRNRLLCKADLQLPENSGYRRFYSLEFKARLCTNLAIGLLASLSEYNLSVGLIDEHASFTTLPKYLLSYTDSVVVVTKESEIYRELNESLLHDIGAPIRISKSKNSLYICDLILAPAPIKDSIGFNNHALILTAQKPEVSVDSTVIYDYHLELSDDLLSIKPKGLSDTYFAGALYTLLKVYSLGSKLPDLCISENKVHTPESLKALLKNIHDKT